MDMSWRALALLITLAASSSVRASDQPTGQTSGASPPPLTSSADATTKIPDDLRLLVGKHVNVGRMLLCIPRSYTPNLAYSGKDALIISFNKNRQFDNLKINLNFMPPNLRQTMDDLSKGGMFVFQFADGTKLDNCADLGFAAISAQLELAAGDTVTLPTEAHNELATSRAPSVETSPTNPTSPEKCPVSITKLSSGNSFGHMLVDSLTTSEFQRQVDQTIHNGQEKHYLDIQARNDSEKIVSAFEFRALYSNKMGDESTSTTYISQNTRPIKPREGYKASAMDRTELSQNGAGQVTLYVSRVRFEDGSLWEDDGTRSCSRVANAS